MPHIAAFRTDADEPLWPAEVFQVFKAADVRQIAYVPDAGHRRLIEMAHADPEIEATVLTTEEEGVALVAGAWLGGQRAVLLMQSSGVGNCVNMLSLIACCRMPLLVLVTMRGEWAEFNPWQAPMGRATPQAFEIMGVRTMRVDAPDALAETVSACAATAFDGDQAIAVLLSQQLIGRKEMAPQMTIAIRTGTLERRMAVAELLKDRGELLLISGLGSSTYDVFAAGDNDANMYLWGAMGGASMMGLGLALAQRDRPVVVITGDGEQLMGAGSLFTIATKQPGNLSIVVLDNGHFGETGMQASHSGLGVDLRRVAEAVGLQAVEISDVAQITAYRAELQKTRGKTRLAVVRISAETPPRALPARDGSYLKTRFRAHLGLPAS